MVTCVPINLAIDIIFIYINYKTNKTLNIRNKAQDKLKNTVGDTKKKNNCKKITKNVFKLAIISTIILLKIYLKN